MYRRKLEGEQNHLGVQGHQATRISCELAGSWQWFRCPDLKLSIIFPSKWQNMQIEDMGSKPGMHCSWPPPRQGSGIVCNVPRGRTISKSLMLQVFSNSRAHSCPCASPEFGDKLFLWSTDSNMSPGHGLHKCHSQKVSNL